MQSPRNGGLHYWNCCIITVFAIHAAGVVKDYLQFCKQVQKANLALKVRLDELNMTI
jgi:hypothetical protein